MDLNQIWLILTSGAARHLGIAAASQALWDHLFFSLYPDSHQKKPNPVSFSVLLKRLTVAWRSWTAPGGVNAAKLQLGGM
jgi:hypothetical protein